MFFLTEWYVLFLCMELYEISFFTTHEVNMVHVNMQTTELESQHYGWLFENGSTHQ